MKLSQLAVQLYTLRDFCKDETSLAETLRKVRAIGYEAVQVSAIGPIAPARVAELCADAGVTICATHEAGDLIRKEPLAAIARLKDFGTPLTAYPYPGGVDFSDVESIKAMLDDLARAGEIFRENGCQLAYHNHAIEFLKVGGKTIMDHVFDGIPAGVVDFELDTYWVQYGGGSPVDWCEKVAGRLPALHLKDYQFLASNAPTYAEIGNGNMNFPAIVAAAEKSGCEWFIVEQDTCPGDPFDSVQASFSYCKEFLCS